MKRMILLLALLIGCGVGATRAGVMEYSEGAVLWTQRSAESHALRLQAFALARLQLDLLLAERSSEARPAAVVVDIDETVLDNSPYQAHLILDQTAYPDGWKEWCEAAEAPALPGAVDFLNHAAARGVEVYYISNRKTSVLAPTIANLQAQGFPHADEAHVLLREKESGKQPRRDRVLATHDILLLLGDNLSDFSASFDGATAEARLAAVEQLEAEWGSRFILIPNPMYGDWEAAVYGHDWSLSPEEREARRRGDLQGWKAE